MCVTNPSKLDSCLNDVARSKNAYALQASNNTNSKEDIPRFNVGILMCLEVFINTFCPIALKKRILIALNIKKERTNLVLSRV